MTIAAEQNDFYEELIRQSLMAVPLTPEQAESAVPALARGVAFLTKKSPLSPDSDFWDFAGKIARSAALLGLKKDEFVKAALKQPSLFYRSPETINANIEGSAALLGLKKDELAKAALKQPPLFCQSPETLNANIEGSAALLGLKKEDFAKAALKQPPLFCQSPETINANIEGSAALLGLKKDEFVKAALKQPSLFYQSPETINANIEGSAALLGLKKEDFAKAALKQPPLFYQSPETINANIEGSAALLGLKKDEFVKAALKQPSLFYRSPETINANIEGSAALLGLKKDELAKAALKQPQLFYQSPETILRNYRYVKNAAAMGHLKNEDRLQSALSFPSAFCYATSNTHLRAVHAHVSKRTYTLSSFFSGKGRDKKTVEGAIIAHYTDVFNRTGRGVRTMQVLHEAGIISALPGWAPAPDSPLRRRGNITPAP